MASSGSQYCTEYCVRDLFQGRGTKQGKGKAKHGWSWRQSCDRPRIDEAPPCLHLALDLQMHVLSFYILGTTCKFSLRRNFLHWLLAGLLYMFTKHKLICISTKSNVIYACSSTNHSQSSSPCFASHGPQHIYRHASVALF